MYCLSCRALWLGNYYQAPVSHWSAFMFSLMPFMSFAFKILSSFWDFGRRRKSIKQVSTFIQEIVFLLELAVHCTIFSALVSAVKMKGWDLCLFEGLASFLMYCSSAHDVNCLLKYQSAEGFPSAFAYRTWCSIRIYGEGPRNKAVLSLYCVFCKFTFTEERPKKWTVMVVCQTPDLFLCL